MPTEGNIDLCVGCDTTSAHMHIKMLARTLALNPMLYTTCPSVVTAAVLLCALVARGSTVPYIPPRQIDDNEMSASPL